MDFHHCGFSRCSLSRRDREGSASDYSICMRHGERENVLETGLTCQSLKGPLRWPQILSICWLNGSRQKKNVWKRQKVKEKKQLGSCSRHWVRREMAALQVTILYKLYGHALNQQGSKGWEGEGGRGRVWFQSKPIYQWAQTKWPWPALGRSIWKRLTGGFNERNDQSRDHLCSGRAHQKKGNCARM